MGLCESLIDGTKTLTEIVVTFINEVLWYLSKKKLFRTSIEATF